MEKKKISSICMYLEDYYEHTIQISEGRLASILVCCIPAVIIGFHVNVLSIILLLWTIILVYINERIFDKSSKKKMVLIQGVHFASVSVISLIIVFRIHIFITGASFYEVIFLVILYLLISLISLVQQKRFILSYKSTKKKKSGKKTSRLALLPHSFSLTGLFLGKSLAGNISQNQALYFAIFLFYSISLILTIFYKDLLLYYWLKKYNINENSSIKVE